MPELGNDFPHVDSHNMEIYSSESSPLASGSPALSNNQLITGILLAVVHKAGSAGERVGGAAGELQALPCVVVPHKCIHPQQAATLGHTAQGIEQTGLMQARAAELCQTVI